MAKHNLLLVLIVFLAIPAISQAQLRSQDKENVNMSSVLRNGGGQIGGVLHSLGLDPSKFSMTHSYSLSFGNVGGYGMSQGMYLNTMRYQVSDPLQVSLQWGVTHSPLQSQSMPSMGSSFFVSGASIDYKPSKSFHVGVQYSSYPAGSRYLYPYSVNGQSSLFNRFDQENR